MVSAALAIGQRPVQSPNSGLPLGCWFEDCLKESVPLVGGKCSSLGELINAGVRVPPGFALTTEGYRRFMAGAGLTPEIASVLAGLDARDLDALERASAKIRVLIEAQPFAEEIEDGVAECYRKLALRACVPAVPLAVRSSATAEDLAGASFAGQQDTSLNVRGIDPLLAAIRDCWASLWTSRAMAYRARQGIDPAGLALAVVVQQMVLADAAGVMFTANPTNGRRDETVVSAAWGLGESVVSGTVTTDDIVVEKKTGQVRTRTTADKTVMTVYTDHYTDHYTDQTHPSDQA